MTGSTATDAEILLELNDLARADESLVQFPCLAGGHQYLRLYRLFRRHVEPGGQALDWGAGNGHFSYFLVRAGYRASGYSLEAWTPPTWLDGVGYRFACGRIHDPVTIPFPEASFDAVASVGVLEHVRETGGNEIASLREIKRVLRPGGVLVCYHLPNRYSLIDAVARLLPVHHHVYRYTRQDISRLAGAVGFELLAAGRYGMLPRNPLGRLPQAVRRSLRLARAYDITDDLLSRLLSPICTNYYFVARSGSSR